ncbi:MAG TPA: acyl-CoA dehydrogenase family protein [Candidatus Binatia bacterium]|jgi:alkylation response protein AidB-like acyl-CoA dehydrogenase|nr:acyl-CoA dehydrogenase family protein [Candidatus Binatia bacterium]
MRPVPSAGSIIHVFHRLISASLNAKWMAKETLNKIMWSAAEACGSTALFQKHPLERFYRDMHLHMMHGRHDIAAEIVGAAELGEPYNVNRTH